VKQIGTALASLKKKERLQIVRYGLDYPPRTRALLGALLKTLSGGMNLEPLAQNLKPLTAYDLGITPDILPTAEKWNIR